jgi:hypothetical protein
VPRRSGQATLARNPAAGRIPGGLQNGCAHLRMLDSVVNCLFRADLNLQDALKLPADSARKRIEEALDDLDDVIREIRGAVFAARSGRRPC